MACPIEFNVDIIPPIGAVIRAEPVYSKLEHFNQMPKRCENHKISKQFDNNGLLAVTFLLCKTIFLNVIKFKIKYLKKHCII